MTFIQNHIGDLQFPGDKHFNPPWAQPRISPRTKAVTTWVVFGTALCAFVVVMCLFNLAGTPERGRAGLLSFTAVLAAVGVLLGVWSWRRWEAARSGLWRAQHDYNQAIGRQAPTAEQLQALQLGTAWDFKDKAWGHSLAKFPCEREVGHLPDWRQRFAMIDPGTVADHRAALMEWWAIGTTASYREMVERLFNGLHSRNLDAAYLRAPDTRSFLDHLAGISDLPIDYVDYCIHGSVRDRGLRPPPRLWGWDLGRIAIIARGAYGAGLIDEEEAWRDMSRASAWARTIFPTRKEFLHNIVLGFAFWSDDFTETHTFGQAVAAALANSEGWPVLAQPWQPGGVTLPEHVWHGWDDLDSDDDQEPVGRP